MSKLTVVPSDEGENKPEGEGKPAHDPFDLNTMRLSQAKLKGSAKKLVQNYTVRKTPRRGSFVRVNPDPDYQYITYVYLDKDEAGMDKETYLVDSDFAEQLDEDFLSVMQSVILYLAFERHADRPFVWRIGIPLNGSKDNLFWSSARELADMAKTQWLRVVPSVGCYEPYVSKGGMPDPVWPKIPFGEILRMAFKDRVIDSMDHDIMKALSGTGD